MSGLERVTARLSGRCAPSYTVTSKGAGGWKANENALASAPTLAGAGTAGAVKGKFKYIIPRFPAERE